MVTDRETTINIWQINSSKKLNISFETVPSFRPIKILITAEENETTQFPGEKIILTTNNFLNNHWVKYGVTNECVCVSATIYKQRI